MREAKNIIDQYFDKMKEAAKTLSELEVRAVEVEAQQQRVEAAYAEIAANESTIEQLHQERRDLMRFYQEADFDGDVSRKAKITKRRQAIDAEVKRLEKEVVRLHTVAEESEPDANEVAELAVALDALNYPNPYDLAEELKRTLWQQDSDLSNRRRTAKHRLPSVDTELYEKAKYGEEEYEQHKRLETLRQEKQVERYQKEVARYEREQRIAAGAVGDRVSTRDLKPWEED